MNTKMNIYRHQTNSTRSVWCPTRVAMLQKLSKIQTVVCSEKFISQKLAHYFTAREAVEQAMHPNTKFQSAIS